MSVEAGVMGPTTVVTYTMLQNERKDVSTINWCCYLAVKNGIRAYLTNNSHKNVVEITKLSFCTFTPLYFSIRSNHAYFSYNSLFRTVFYAQHSHNIVSDLMSMLNQVHRTKELLCICVLTYVNKKFDC